MSRDQTSSAFHKLRIERWNFDYTFGVNPIPEKYEPYVDYRQLVLNVHVVRPTGIKATEGSVICFPDEGLAPDAPRRQGKRAEGSKGGLLGVGHVSYRGKDYHAHLHMPPDALPLVLTMLASGKYRFVSFEAAAGSKDAIIARFGFSETIEDDPD